MDAQGRHFHLDPPGVGGGPHAQVELFKSGLEKITFPFFPRLFLVSKQAKTQYVFPLTGPAEPQWKPGETGDRKVRNKISS